MERPVLPIDIANKSRAVVLLAERQGHPLIPNRAQALGEMTAWLEDHRVQQTHMK